jgi:hypothetical protein
MAGFALLNGEEIHLSFASAARFVAGICAAAIVLPPVAIFAQELPRLHITALGLHADQSIVAPGQSFHVTVHVHVLERRDRLDELVLPALTNAVDLGDERRRVATPAGTDFYETLTVAAEVVGNASFSPAYIDAIDPATGRAMRYSSQPLSVRVAAGTSIAAADPAALARLLRNWLLAIAAIALVLLIAFVALVRRQPRRRGMPPPRPQPPPPPPRAAPGDPLRAALEAFRRRRDDATLDAVRNQLFTLAGAGPGATLADALQAVGSRDPVLVRAMAVAERARFGPAGERASAVQDLLEILDAYGLAPTVTR